MCSFRDKPPFYLHVIYVIFLQEKQNRCQALAFRKLQNRKVKLFRSCFCSSISQATAAERVVKVCKVLSSAQIVFRKERQLLIQISLIVLRSRQILIRDVTFVSFFTYQTRILKRKLVLGSQVIFGPSKQYTGAHYFRCIRPPITLSYFNF